MIFQCDSGLAMDTLVMLIQQVFPSQMDNKIYRNSLNFNFNPSFSVHPANLCGNMPGMMVQTMVCAEHGILRI